MGHENENNRSTALTPELMATVNAATAAAVKEAVSGISGMFADLVRELAITPEKLREANKPYKDPAIERREMREKMKFKQEEIDNEKEKQRQRLNCRHHYKNNLLAVALVNNFQDRQTRGICMLCHDWIHPREWRIDNPTEENPRGVAHIVDAHKDYNLVIQAANQQNG
jgi:hypothetical protein